METGTCKYCLEQKPLVESHLVPRAVYDLCGVKGEFVMLTARVVSYTARQRKHSLLCRDCDAAMSVDGEDWTIPLLARMDGTFPLYDLLQKIPPDYADAQVAGYSVSRNPEIDVFKLTHFGVGVFWRASVHSWRGKESGNLIEIGPYSEELRKFLRREGPFPKFVGLTVAMLPPPVRHIAFCEPYRGAARELHHFMFYVPGIAFALAVGKKIGDAKDNCFYSNPAHPIVVSEISDDLKAVMRKVAKNARMSRRLIDEGRSRGRW